jgi:hypothetical protein
MTDHREVRAIFRFPEHDLKKLREIAENWADCGYVTANNLLKLEKAGMRDVAKIPHDGPRRNANLELKP